MVLLGASFLVYQKFTTAPVVKPPVVVPPVVAKVGCTLVVPADAFSQAGIAAPWQLQAPCHEATQSVFVQGVIFDTVNKTFSVYSPLVIDAGTIPAVAPVVPMLPKDNVIAFWGGGNDDLTTLAGFSTQCVNGEDGKVFGQEFFCGADKFWATVNAAGVVPPALGVGLDGVTCPTTRSFEVVDQDQSDNVQTTYLVTAQGTTAQDTAANKLLLLGAATLKNASDNRLLTNFIDPALGCTPWMVPNLADGGNLVSAQALDEFQAAFYQAAPVALIPAGDPMVGPNSLNMVNAYRMGVDQPVVATLNDASTVAYCTNLKAVQPPFLIAHQVLFTAAPSPVPAAGANLYLFMVGRLAATNQILGCAA
jgi:hypothetical protein